ncbi:histone deacetylase family protein [Nitratireductor pacificus]|uniref:Histone deacetylase family protein n=1 Tax=Nitratireductor pacificus pht-3B TaxID=391937 RepID=K2MPF7_9HYPH|nr:histone deacetylase family protein [Nitratireductor pacificus]EKF19162.1 histone deacetylase family protein [Nitratireductor pacificus pht-3B]
MIVVHHPDQALHDPEFVFRMGQFLPQPDRAERYHIFLREARKHASRVVEAPLGDLEPVLAVHDEDYVRFFETVWERWRAVPGAGPEVIPSVHPTHRMRRRPKDLLGELGWYSNSTSCPIGEGSFAAARASAASAVHAADLVLERQGPVYALCRPPGHHAYRDLMSGVCFFNNAAIAAERLARRLGRVAIIDIDVHHGNGTQDIFWERGDILFASLHVDPDYGPPYYAGYAGETGEGAGRGLTLNMPLPVGTGDAAYLAALDHVLGRVRQFAPGAVVVSAGLDASAHDPVQTFKLSNDGFATIAGRIVSLALPTLLVQEGGYLNPNLAACLGAFLNGFED